VNIELSFKTFMWSIIVGMGLHLGWGLISLVVWLAAKAVGTQVAF
jgi:hypothetical protein